MREVVDAMGRSMGLRTRDQSAIKLDKDSRNSTCSGSGRLSPQRYYVLCFPSVFHESERSIVERLPEGSSEWRTDRSVAATAPSGSCTNIANVGSSKQPISPSEIVAYIAGFHAKN